MTSFVVVHENVWLPVGRGIQGNFELDALARNGSLRLPSVALLEFIPIEIGAGMTEY